MSVANKGASDLEAHVNSAKHKTAASGESSSSEVAEYFVIKTDTATMDAARGVKCEVTEYFVSETETTTMAAARGESSSSEVADYFVSKTDTTTAAEGTLAFHSITHHNSYRSMDCTSGLLRKVFTDSVTAPSAHTKTEAIVNAVIAPHSVEVALEALEEIPHCGVSTDGSNHGAENYFLCSFNILIGRMVVCKVNYWK